MQHLILTLTQNPFHCPVSGDFIIKEGDPLYENASSLIAYRHNEFFEEPLIKDPVFAKARQDFYEEGRESLEEDDDLEASDLLEAFFDNYHEDNW
jgi:hypothetical protein